MVYHRWLAGGAGAHELTFKDLMGLWVWGRTLSNLIISLLRGVVE